jgi:tRNA-Thr(GGU) m(6)t(6)A37 methyltransferase TsaA
MLLSITPIGILNTPFQSTRDMPIQASEAAQHHGSALIDPAWRAGLADVAGFSRIWVLWWAHQAVPATALVTPFRDVRQRGVFATRSPSRPNPIAMSCVQVLAVHEDRIDLAGVDMLDGTPLIDIKPYVPMWDAFPGVAAGWYDQAGRPTAQSDERFLVP